MTNAQEPTCRRQAGLPPKNPVARGPHPGSCPLGVTGGPGWTLNLIGQPRLPGTGAVPAVSGQGRLFVHVCISRPTDAWAPSIAGDHDACFLGAGHAQAPGGDGQPATPRQPWGLEGALRAGEGVLTQQTGSTGCGFSWENCPSPSPRDTAQEIPEEDRSAAFPK